MARLETYSEEERNHLLSLPCPEYESTPFVTPPDPAAIRLALISTAGLHRRDDRPFSAGAGDFRLIPADTRADDLVMSHISTNYDRTGFQMDANLVFPLDRLRELEKDGIFGNLARYHYSFMGATEPAAMESAARDLAGIMKKDGVNAVLLVPV